MHDLNDPVDLLALAMVTLFIVIPVIRGVHEAWSKRDPWAPFVSRSRGKSGPLMWGRSFSGLRAPRPGGRTTRGLIGRWAFFAGLAVVFGGGALYNTFLR